MLKQFAQTFKNFEIFFYYVTLNSFVFGSFWPSFFSYCEYFFQTCILFIFNDCKVNKKGLLKQFAQTFKNFQICVSFNTLLEKKLPVVAWNFVVWLPFLHGIFDNIAIIFSLVDHIINFEIFLSFLIKPFSCMTKNVRTKSF